MTTLALNQGMRVYLGAIPPITGFLWRPEIAPGNWVLELNTWLRDWAAKQDITFVDYHAAMADEAGGLRGEFTRDRVHPNWCGHVAMRQVLEARL